MSKQGVVFARKKPEFLVIGGLQVSSCAVLFYNGNIFTKFIFACKTIMK